MGKEEENIAFAGWDEAVDAGSDFVEVKEPLEDETEDTIETEEETSEESDGAFEAWADSTQEGDEDSIPPAEGVDEDVEKPVEKDQASITLEFLKTKGLADFELEEGETLETLTPERKEELINDSYEATIEERLTEILSGMSPYMKGLNKFVLNGGDPKDYTESSNPSITPDMDLDNESNQILIIKTQLQKEGKTSEEINDEIEFLKEKDRLKTNATSKHSRYIKEQEEIVKAQTLKNKELKKSKEAAQREHRASLEKFVKDAETAKGLKLNKKEKVELPSFMHDKSIVLEDGSKVSEMQMSLHKALQDPEKSLALAKLLKSDFDFSSIEASEKNKITKKVKDTLRGAPTAKSADKRTKNFVEYL